MSHFSRYSLDDTSTCRVFCCCNLKIFQINICSIKTLVEDIIQINQIGFCFRTLYFVPPFCFGACLSVSAICWSISASLAFGKFASTEPVIEISIFTVKYNKYPFNIIQDIRFLEQIRRTDDHFVQILLLNERLLSALPPETVTLPQCVGAYFS